MICIYDFKQIFSLSQIDQHLNEDWRLELCDELVWIIIVFISQFFPFDLLYIIYHTSKHIATNIYTKNWTYWNRTNINCVSDRYSTIELMSIIYGGIESNYLRMVYKTNALTNELPPLIKNSYYNSELLKNAVTKNRT